MHYLVFTNTPAHVYLYRHVVNELRENGHEVLILARDYTSTKALLEYFNLPYQIYGKQTTNSGSVIRRAPKQFFSIAKHAPKFDPDVIFGRGLYAAFAGIITRSIVILVLDSNPSPMMHKVSSRFAETVLTPNAYGHELGDHHRRFHGLKECAYLHPDVFEPDPTVRGDLGVDSNEPFVVLRFNAFDAFHDIGDEGLSDNDRRDLIRKLAESATVFVSDEGGLLDIDDLPARPYDLHPARIHDTLAEASLVVADTGTIVTEAALLGTPVIRYDPNRDETMFGEFEELERNDLAVIAETYKETLETADDLLTDEESGRRWTERRDQFLEDRVNLTDLLVNVAERPREVETVVEPPEVPVHAPR